MNYVEVWSFHFQLVEYKLNYNTILKPKDFFYLCFYPRLFNLLLYFAHISSVASLLDFQTVIVLAMSPHGLFLCVPHWGYLFLFIVAAVAVVLRICFHWFLDREERIRREGNIDVREKHQLIASGTRPSWEVNLQTRYVPWLEIKSTILWWTKWCFRKLSHQPGLFLFLE